MTVMKDTDETEVGQWHRNTGPSRGGRTVEGKLSRAPRRLGAPPSLKNIKYTKMRNLKKIKNFILKGALRECFPGPRSGS